MNNKAFDTAIKAMATGMMSGNKAIAEGKSPAEVKKIQLAAEAKAYESK